jgi:hypothetical protein
MIMAGDKAIQGLAILADAVITAYLVNEERKPIVASVRAWEAEGKTPEEMTALLKAGRVLSEDEAQDAIDAAREGGG